jgi:hypothetical protein
MPFRHENRQTKFSGSRFATKEVAVKKNHAVLSRKQTNQIFGKPFCHEKSCREKKSCRFVAKTDKPNFREAVLPRKKLP